MGKAIQMAHEQKIRLDNHLSESTHHTEANFFSLPEEIEASIQIIKILNKNHPSY